MDFITKFTLTDGRDGYAFEGGWCQLAPHHRNKLRIDGAPFYSVHHYVECRKARFFKDEDSYKMILKAKNTAEQSKLARGIVGYDPQQWTIEMKEHMRRGYRELFLQYPRIFKGLKETGDGVIACCSEYDRMWATGFSISDEEKLKDKDTWGGNMTGELLMELRGQ